MEAAYLKPILSVIFTVVFNFLVELHLCRLCDLGYSRQKTCSAGLCTLDLPLSEHLSYGRLRLPGSLGIWLLWQHMAVGLNWLQIA